LGARGDRLPKSRLVLIALEQALNAASEEKNRAA
jgi:hypothetical protein